MDQIAQIAAVNTVNWLRTLIDTPLVFIRQDSYVVAFDDVGRRGARAGEKIVTAIYVVKTQEMSDLMNSRLDTMVIADPKLVLLQQDDSVVRVRRRLLTPVERAATQIPQ